MAFGGMKCRVHGRLTLPPSFTCVIFSGYVFFYCKEKCSIVDSSLTIPKHGIGNTESESSDSEKVDAMPKSSLTIPKHGICNVGSQSSDSEQVDKSTFSNIHSSKTGNEKNARAEVFCSICNLSFITRNFSNHCNGKKHLRKMKIHEKESNVEEIVISDTEISEDNMEEIVISDTEISEENISYNDFLTLNIPEWINDNIINELKSENYSIQSTFFLESIVRNEETFQKSKAKYKITEQTKAIIIPVNIKHCHWYLVIVTLDTNPTIIILDSKPQTNHHLKTVDSLNKYLQTRTIVTIPIVKTQDSYNCGIFVIMYVEQFILDHSKNLINDTWTPSVIDPNMKRKDISQVIKNISRRTDKRTFPKLNFELEESNPSVVNVNEIDDLLQYHIDSV